VATQSFPLTGNASPLAQLAIRPQGAPDFGVRLTVRALHAGTTVVSQRAAVAFVPDEAWQVDIFLSSDCTGSNVCTDPRLVCIKGGSCVSEANVAPPRPYPGAGNDAGSADTGRDVGGPTLGTWKLASTPNVPTGATLNKVWPITANDVWVVGAMGTRGVAYHYDGSTWTAVAPPTAVPTLYAVWASGTDDVWAVGASGAIAHHTAGLWTPTVSISTTSLSGVWGFAANDVTAIGAGGAVLHWNGTLWSTVAAGIADDLFAVAGDSAGGLWAVGSKGVVFRGSASTWQPQLHGKTTSGLFAVWASSATNVWAAGASVALHLSGTTWSLANGTPDTTLGLWGSAADDVWAVGLDAAGTSSAISHFDGNAWTAVAVPAGTGLQSVRGTAAGDVWAVGNGGQILHYQAP
jgi:hypothetical protein